MEMDMSPAPGEPPGLETRQQVEAYLLSRQWHRDFVSHEFDEVIGPPGLLIRATVFNPGQSIGAKFLARNMAAVADRLEGRCVLDLGSGCGILGIAAAQLGASRVTFTDLNPAAVANSLQNARRYGLEPCDGYVSNLFDGLEGRSFDVIIANLPGGTEEVSLADTADVRGAGKDENGIDFVKASLFGPAGLIKRFLAEARHHLTKGGLVIAPTSSLRAAAGRADLLGSKLGYSVERLAETRQSDGLRQSILLLEPEIGIFTKRNVEHPTDR